MLQELWAKDECEGRTSIGLPGSRRHDEGQRIRSPTHAADKTDRAPWWLASTSEGSN